ncbi:MAG: hypothetical protein AMJ43_05525 [Coxiella sp. DG_40]|nr:MAG: hypothetical protein AMJ43_05525 [Coxiella sp. DG_40]
MFTRSQKTYNSWINNLWSWMIGVMTNRKTLGLLMFALLASSGNGLTLLGRQEERSNGEEDGIVPSNDVGGALNRIYIAGTPIELPMPFDPRQQAADAMGLRSLEELSELEELEEFESYLAELGDEGQEQEEQEEYSETKQAETSEGLTELVTQESEVSEAERAEKDAEEVRQLKPRADTGIINYQPVGDPVVVGDGTYPDIACSNSADTCLTTWYRGGIHEQAFKVPDLTKLNNETVFGGIETEFQVAGLSNGGYGLAYNTHVDYNWDDLRVKMITADGKGIRELSYGVYQDGLGYEGPSVTSTNQMFIETVYGYYRRRQAITVGNDGVIGGPVVINDSGYVRRGAVAGRGGAVVDVFHYGSNTLIAKFVNMNNYIVSAAYPVPFDSEIPIGPYQSVEFGEANEVLVATDSSDAKVYLMFAHAMNDNFFTNCSYSKQYLIPGMNSGPIETRYIGRDSNGRSIIDITGLDLSGNLVGVRCWYDADSDQLQCSEAEIIRPNVRASSTAVTHGGELVRSFWTSDDKVVLQKYACSPVPCAQTPTDAASFPSDWSNSRHGLSSDTESGNSKIGAIVGPLLGVGLFSSAATGTAYGVHRCRKNKSRMQSVELDQILSGIEVDPSKVKEGKLLGEGAYGKVFSGFYEHLKIAIKMINYALIESGSIDEYKREVEVMKSLRINVVQLVGVCDKEYYGSKVFCIIMELMEGGTLKEVLDKNINITTRVKYAMDVALALREMHENGVLHRDIKPENVFLTKDKNTAKLGDFGVSKIVRAGQQQTMIPIGTPLYMAPELLSKNAREATTSASDVYSFGLLLYEVITGKVPYNDYEKQYQIDLAKDKGILPEIPSYCPQEITVLINKCCARNSAERPSMDQVYNSLNSYHEKHVANVDVRCTMTP